MKCTRALLSLALVLAFAGPVAGQAVPLDLQQVRAVDRLTEARPMPLGVDDAEGATEEAARGFGPERRKRLSTMPPWSGAVLCPGYARSIGWRDARGRFQVRGAWPAPGGVRSAVTVVRFAGIPDSAILTPLSFSR